ncbi:MAG: L,D-transpeptidase [Rhizobiales bacterium]|nr:L,D-transpeptidase [Hyphomicrobiales bacterium]
MISTLSRRHFLRAGTIAAAAALVPGSVTGALANQFDPADPFPIEPTDLSKIDPEFHRQIVAFREAEWPGTIVVDTESRHLYLVLEGRRAIRYGVGVGREGFGWSGEAVVGRKKMWPRWTPPADMVARDPEAAKWADGMPGGPDNPLGARALYLFAGGEDTLYRIHGTNQPWTIGKNMSSGCIRMLNEDIADLYRRVPIGSRVLVYNGLRPSEMEVSAY